MPTSPRRSGSLVSLRHRTPDAGVRDSTIRNELHFLISMIGWAQAFRVNGRRLLVSNVLYGVTIPREKNAKRPIATESRYRQLLAVADRAETAERLERAHVGELVAEAQLVSDHSIALAFVDEGYTGMPRRRRRACGNPGDDDR